MYKQHAFQSEEHLWRFENVLVAENQLLLKYYILTLGKFWKTRPEFFRNSYFRGMRLII